MDTSDDTHTPTTVTTDHPRSVSDGHSLGHSDSSYSQTQSQSQSQSQEERDHERTQELLRKRLQLTEALFTLPYDLLLYLERATCHSELAYPDLAAGDAYRALLLVDEVREEGWEHHSEAVQALSKHIEEGDWEEVLGARGVEISPVEKERDEGVHRGLAGEGESAPQRRGEQETRGERDEYHEAESNDSNENGHGDKSGDTEGEQAALIRLAERASIRCYQILSISLLLCGCLKSAYEFCTRGLNVLSTDEGLLHALEYIQKLARRRLKLSDETIDLDISLLPDQGLVRREIYPWNSYEPDRFSNETLEILNKELAVMAPKCEVRATELPTLVESAVGDGETNTQLGLFAKEDIFAGEVVLDEFSLLTANNRLKASLCDACSSPLPSLDAAADEQAISCSDCDDTLFCSQHCHDAAMLSYHPAICDKDIDTFAKDPDPKETPNALYLLLLARSFAMSTTQSLHPLDLAEVRHIWGSFLPTTANEVPLSPTAGPPPIWTLPFTFASNISGPLHILETMDLDIFDVGLKEFDFWVVNTLHAKFRGTASARVAPRDGRPEVAAVHPIWCLANHNCAPNVGWEWGGRMRLFAREGPGVPLVEKGPLPLGVTSAVKIADEASPGTAEPSIRSETSAGMRKVAIHRDSEILNHYCDIELPVQERREWAMGSLGGWCMCNRCRIESGELPDGDEKEFEAGDMEERKVIPEEVERLRN